MIYLSAIFDHLMRYRKETSLMLSMKWFLQMPMKWLGLRWT